MSPKRRQSYRNCSIAHWPGKVEELKPREKGAWRDWKIPDDIFLEPMEPEDLDAAEGKFADEFGIARPRKS